MTYHFHKSLETNISIEAISWPETPPAPLIGEPHGTVVEDPQILWRTPDFQKGPQVIHWRPQDFRWRLSSDFHWRPQDFCLGSPIKFWVVSKQNLGVANKNRGVSNELFGIPIEAL